MSYGGKSTKDIEDELRSLRDKLKALFSQVSRRETTIWDLKSHKVEADREGEESTAEWLQSEIDGESAANEADQKEIEHLQGGKIPEMEAELKGRQAATASSVTVTSASKEVSAGTDASTD